MELKTQEEQKGIIMVILLTDPLDKVVVVVFIMLEAEADGTEVEQVLLMVQREVVRPI